MAWKFNERSVALDAHVTAQVGRMKKKKKTKKKKYKCEERASERVAVRESAK